MTGPNHPVPQPHHRKKSEPLTQLDGRKRESGGRWQQGKGGGGREGVKGVGGGGRLMERGSLTCAVFTTSTTTTPAQGV